MTCAVGGFNRACRFDVQTKNPTTDICRVKCHADSPVLFSETLLLFFFIVISLAASSLRLLVLPPAVCEAQMKGDGEAFARLRLGASTVHNPHTAVLTRRALD